MSRLFKQSVFFNPEAIGGWKRDTVRQVDVVQGSFFMIPTALWRRLGGFDRRYFMYGEEADLCLRAATLGYRPMITPDAQIMHLGGASEPERRQDAADLDVEGDAGARTLAEAPGPGRVVRTLAVLRDASPRHCDVRQVVRAV